LAKTGRWEIWQTISLTEKARAQNRVLAQVREEALDASDAKFAWGAVLTVRSALQAAYSAYREERFLA